MIILTASDANQVRGLTVPGHALAPSPLIDGTFALPEITLNDPYHVIHKAFLSTLDIRLDSTIRPGTLTIPGDPNSPIINSDWSQDRTLLKACTYKSSWRAGELVTVDTSKL